MNKNTTKPTYGAVLSFIDRSTIEKYVATVQQLRLDPERVQVFGEGFFGFKSMLITEFDERYQLVSGESLQEVIEKAKEKYQASIKEVKHV